MNRMIWTFGGVLSASSLLLMDSAIKGTVLLALAAMAALMLRRDSAATRHLVWMMAIVALLIVPVLSATLPQWRVLPNWMSSPRPSVAAIESSSDPTVAKTNGALMEVPHRATSVLPLAPAEVDPSAMPDPQPAAPTQVSQPTMIAPREIPTQEVGIWSWINAIPLVWALGFVFLMLRLSAARWMLWSSERLAVVVGQQQDSQIAAVKRKEQKASQDPLFIAMTALSGQLKIRRSITLLIHPHKTIPVVWGIFRCRLMLPVAARQWSEEQLRSVLMHELAHIKRGDILVQLLTQVACALHWFNPLVWIAAWRLDVERERACDDLVLASGIRPSAYAAHLLDVVSGLSAARWTQACGLAMARKSSLEGRLTAVLGENLNRRSVSATLAVFTMLIAVGIAVPIAMLRGAQPFETNLDANAMNSEPNDDKSKALLDSWKTSARTDGKIPGGRIGELATELKTRIDLNPGSQTSVSWEAALKKCDVTRDWSPSEAALLLDEIEVAVPGLAESAMWTNKERMIHFGKKLPDELKDAPWGSPEAQGEQLETSSVALRGLRMAWLLEPKEESYALGGVLKSRVLFHNTGKIPVCFATENWIQSGMHTAKDAAGKEISVWATQRLGERTRMIFCLAPGEYAEVDAHSIGIGSHESATNNRNQQAGAWVEAKPGDLVTFLPGKLHVSFQTWQNNEGRKDSKTVWNETIAARVAQESPWPTSVADRDLLIKRVTVDLGIPLPNEEFKSELLKDNSSNALVKLTAQLQAAGASMHFSGELSSGGTTFKVTEARPNVAAVNPPADKPQAIMPNHKDARLLFENWQNEISSADSAGKWPMPGGVTLEVKRELFHGADVETSAVLTWPEDATGTTHAFSSSVASDAFGNREPWHVAWERNSASFWTIRGNLGDHGPGLAKLFCVNRIDFADKSKIVTTTWYHRPDEMPKGIQLAFEKVFERLPTTPRRASEAEGSTRVEQAHDVRPIEELLHGVWKSSSSEPRVQMTFPEQNTGDVQWTIDYGKGTPAIDAKLAMIRVPANNAIRLWIRPSQLSNVDERDIVGTVRRGPDSTLLLDITGSPKFPDYKKVLGIVLSTARVPGTEAPDDKVQSTGQDASKASTGETLEVSLAPKSVDQKTSRASAARTLDDQVIDALVTFEFSGVSGNATLNTAGIGWVVDQRGHILVPSETAPRSEDYSIEVRYADGSRTSAKRVFTFGHLALLKPEKAPAIAPIKLNSQQAVQDGDQVLAILNGTDVQKGTVTSAKKTIVSLDSWPILYSPRLRFPNAIETDFKSDAATLFGAPLLAPSGEVVGMLLNYKPPMFAIPLSEIQIACREFESSQKQTPETAVKAAQGAPTPGLNYESKAPAIDHRNARSVVEAYVASAFAGDVAMAASLAKNSPADPKRIRELPEFLNVQRLKIETVYINDPAKPTQALATSVAVKLDEEHKQPDGRRDGFMVFTLELTDDKWLVTDIDFESESGAEKELNEFLKANPKSIGIPPHS